VQLTHNAESSTGSSCKKRRYKTAEWKGRNKTVPFCRFVIYLCGKFQGIYKKKPPRTNKGCQLVVGHKRYTQKSIIFPYTSDKYMGTDTKNTSFTIAF